MRLFRSTRVAIQPAQLQLAVAPSGGVVPIYRSDTAEILEGPQPIQAHLTLILIGGMFLSLFLIVATMRVDRIITSEAGKTVTVEPTVVLGALDQSIIKTLDVREGQEVAKGQVLATLDPTFTTADVGALKAQIASLTAQIARCQAELAQKPFDMAPSSDPMMNTFILSQREYYLERKAQYDAQVRSYDEQIAQYKATIVKYQTDQARYGDRAKISQEIEQMRSTLAAEQFGSKLELLGATDQKLEIQRSLEFDRNAVAESQHQLESTMATRDAFIQQWFGQVSQEMVTAQGTRDGAVQQLAKATKHQELVRLEAPVDSMVLKIAKLSSQSVLSPNDPLIYLAPLDSPLQAEFHVAPKDIGFIRVGDDTKMKLDAYNFIEHGTVSGKIKSISEGTYTDDDGRTVDPYYKVAVTLLPVTLRNVPPSFRLVPGITLSGDIHIGTRSLLTYLTGGFQRGVNEAMREP